MSTMAWRAKQKALEWRFGSYKDSYHHLPHLLELLQSRNPGTIIDIDDYQDGNADRVLRRVFWSFGCMINFHTLQTSSLCGWYIFDRNV